MNLVIDAGTTNLKVFVFDGDQIVWSNHHRLHRNSSKPSWVEQDPLEISDKTIQLSQAALAKFPRCSAIGITNQRETTIVWHRKTGHPVTPAIVWEDKRTEAIAKNWQAGNLNQTIYQSTGLVPSSYFSAFKLKWIIDNVTVGWSPKDLCFGTVDSWLLFWLTGEHKTDETNASRTMLYSIIDQKWDLAICQALGIPPELLPEVSPSLCDFGTSRFKSKIPVRAIAGDQQASLLAAGNLPGTIKITAGTGLFVSKLTGEQPVYKEGYTTSLAVRLTDKPCYYLEGHLEGTGQKYDKALNHPETKTEVAEQIAKDTARLLMPLWDSSCREIVIDGGMSLDQTFITALHQTIKHPIRIQTTHEGTALGIAKLLVTSPPSESSKIKPYK